MSRSSSTPVFQETLSTPEPSNVPTMSLSADSTPQPRIMKPMARPGLQFNSSLQGKSKNMEVLITIVVVENMRHCNILGVIVVN